MKRMLALLMLVMPLGMAAQDSAEAVVGRYLRLAAYDHLPADSLLVMETTITYDSRPDTFLMRRYYQVGGMMRLEVWHGDTLTHGLCTNGTTRYRRYVRLQQWWDDMRPDELLGEMQPYDFRGPLHDWQQRGIRLAYEGRTTLKGQPMQVVRAEQLNRYTRLYLFDPLSGLLVMTMELNEMPEGSVQQLFPVSPIEFKAWHEYLPAGGALVPSLESFRRDGELCIMATSLHFEPRNNLLFNQDNR